MKKHLFTILMAFMGVSLFAEGNLMIMQNDIAIEYTSDIWNADQEGVFLFVKKNPDVESIMLVEAVKDPEGKNDNYAYRAMEYNPVNGDEIRYLNGKPLTSQFSKYSLVSSTVVEHRTLGPSFCIFIPKTLVYGYEWTRNGSIEIGKGTFINIRTFEKKYADYTGSFSDNPFMFDLVVRQEVKLTTLVNDYNPLAAQSFAQISSEGKGIMTYSKGPETLARDIGRVIEKMGECQEGDILFCVDTTGSMADDLECLETKWLPELEKQLAKIEKYRLGLLFYRDYNDSYNFRRMPVKIFNWTSDLEIFGNNLKSAMIRGKEGGDEPEAVYEALYSAMSFFSWNEGGSKNIILVGDAQPHPKPRGVKQIGFDEVMNLAKKKDIHLNCIIVPDNKAERGR